MKDRREIKVIVNITDWGEEHSRIEPKLQSNEDLMDLIRDPNFGPSQIGRLAIVSREKKESPDNIISSNKLLLNAGAAAEISHKAAQLMTKARLENGNEIEVRELVANVRDGEVEDIEEMEPISPDFSFVSSGSKVGVERASKYLQRTVPGYIYGRLGIIAKSGGDVAGEAERLKAKIDDMVKRLA